jgi:predicted flap endonuclease-1-like 5' DNA nuclease
MVTKRPIGPEQSAEVLRRAGAKAVAMRRERAAVKASLASGEMSVADVLAKSGMESIARMKARDLLRALPGVGAVRADKLLEDLGISQRRTLRGLGTRQREALIAEFPAEPE